jgi:hypothetical protein
MKKTFYKFKKFFINKTDSPAKSIILLMTLLLIDVLILMSCEDVRSQPKSISDKVKSEVEYGKYLVKVAGCNDCHTVGYGEKNGEIPESEWLSGSPVGFKGPWGTTYPSNLRLFVQNTSEAEWLEMAQKRNSMPPMPWVSLKAMNEKDLLAIYHFIKDLGPTGKMVPTFVPPPQEPKTPYIVFEPQHMERLSQIPN